MGHADPSFVVFYVLASVMAITFHEAAHGWVAWKRGDPTAFQLGRVTFNPLVHIDPFGTVLLPAMLALSGLPLFGWAKPVPVNEGRLRNPRRDGALVSIAGVTMNFLLAVVFALLLRFVVPAMPSPAFQENLVKFLLLAIQLNLVFAVFNFLPIPPLDGYRFLSSFLPPRLSFRLARIEPYGLWIVLGGLLLLPWVLAQLGIPFNPLDFLLLKPVVALRDGIFAVLGLG